MTWLNDPYWDGFATEPLPKFGSVIHIRGRGMDYRTFPVVTHAVKSGSQMRLARAIQTEAQKRSSTLIFVGEPSTRTFPRRDIAARIARFFLRRQLQYRQTYTYVAYVD